MSVLAFDTTLRRPGCALIQAALGGDTRAANRFPSETWLTGLTPDMKLYRVTEEQVTKLIEMAKEACGVR